MNKEKITLLGKQHELICCFRINWHFYIQVGDITEIISDKSQIEDLIKEMMQFCYDARLRKAGAEKVALHISIIPPRYGQVVGCFDVTIYLNSQGKLQCCAVLTRLGNLYREEEDSFGNPIEENIKYNELITALEDDSLEPQERAKSRLEI